MGTSIPRAFADPLTRPRLGVVRGLFQGGFFARYLAGIHSMASGLGLDVAVFDAPGGELAEPFAAAVRERVDAIAVSSGEFSSIGPQIDEAIGRGIRVFGFDMLGEHPGIPALEQDDPLIGFMIARQLVTDCEGTAHVVYANPGVLAPLLKRDRPWQDVKGRYRCLNEVARIGRLTDHVAADTELAVSRLLVEHPEINVVLATWDELARGAVRAINRAGAAGRVRVYSVDVTDEDIAMMTAPVSPWVATVATDARNLGRIVVRAAAALIAGERVGRYLFAEPQLVTREFLLNHRIGSLDDLVRAMPTLGDSPLVWYEWMEPLLARNGRQKPIASLTPERLITVSSALRKANAVLETEIAERRRIEEQLRFANLVLRTQQETSSDGIVVFDGKGEVLSHNRRFVEMWRVPAGVRVERFDDGLRRVVAEQVADPEGFFARIQEIEETTASSFDELTLRDGRIFERFSAPMFGSDRVFHGRVWHFRDVTARRQAEQAAREADRRKDEFLAVLSHELRNPLSPIRNGLFVLGRAQPGSEPARRALTVIDRQVSHLARLVDDLLDVTRIARGKIQLRGERLELGELLRRTAEDHRAAFEGAGIAFEVRLAPEPMWLEADATRVAQIVGNLLANAIKFTPRGGQVTMTLVREGDVAILKVRDDGVGIAPEVLGRLFQPFSQAAQTIARSRGGLGLGLALVRGLAELHGGTASAASEGQNKGAEFTVRLPLAEAPRPSAPEAEAGNMAPRRVLVIEDNVDAAENLKDALEMMGHEVRVAFDGATGIAAARRFTPDVVLCDIGLPGIDGYEVARRFRADEQLRRSVLVALTGYALPEDRRRAEEVGFVRHVAKPPRLEVLEQVVGTLGEAESHPA